MRRRRQQTVTLFAFQDIITGVAGVMLFILLLLVVQLTVQTTAKVAEEKESTAESPNADPTENEPPPWNHAVAELELGQLREQLSVLQSKNDELLQASKSNVGNEIAAAKFELAERVRKAKEARENATSIASDIKSQKLSPEKQAVLQQRDRLRQQLEAMRAEQELHERGKLVAFNASNRNRNGMWVVDTTDVKARLFDVNEPEQVLNASYQRDATPQEIAAKIRAALSKSSRSRSIILVLRPSVAGIGSELIAAFRGSGFTIALELLDEDTVITRQGRSTDEGSTKEKTR